MTQEDIDRLRHYPMRASIRDWMHPENVDTGARIVGRFFFTALFVLAFFFACGYNCISPH